jgi:hypothetical protein
VGGASALAVRHMDEVAEKIMKIIKAIRIQFAIWDEIKIKFYVPESYSMCLSDRC